MKKNIRIPLIVLFSLLLLIMILAGTVWLQRDAIKQYVINQLNEQLTAPVSVKAIGISFFDQFPKVSVRFEELSIKDPIRQKRFLFKSQRVYVAFNIYDILSKNYRIKLIEADSGMCNLYIDKKGRTNFSIFKPTGNPQEDVFLKLTEVRLKHVKIMYQDELSVFEMAVEANNAVLSGDFKGKKESIGVQGNFQVQRMVVGSATILKDKEVILETLLHIDQQKENYLFSKSLVKIGALALTCSGSISNTKMYSNMDIEFGAPSLRITDLLELLPGAIHHKVAEYKSTGSIYFNGSIKGKLSNKLTPAIKVQFGVENGTLTAEKGTVSLNHLNCKGEISNGKSGKLTDSYLDLPVLSFDLGGGQFAGALNIKNFNDPFMDMSMKGAAPINDLIRFVGNDWIKQAEGQLKVDLALSGKLKQLSSRAGFLECKTSGSIDCDASHIQFVDGKKTIEHLKTTMHLRQKDMVIETFTAKVDQSDVQVTGSLVNMVPYLLSKNQQLEADIHYRSTYLDVENMIVPVAVSSPKEISANTGFSMPENVWMNASIDIGQLRFHEFKAQKLKGNIVWKGKRISTDGLTAETLNGKIAVKGQIENTENGNFVVSSSTQFTQVDIDELFRQCNNFGQQSMTSKNIKGKLQGNIDLNGIWDVQLNCDLDKLSALCSITIKQGELLNYKPLEGLSRYVKLEDLRDLKFADLSNQIEIRKRTITIPEMMVNNNALNLSLSGTHTFANYLDYHFKIRLNDLLFKKFKQRNNEFEEAETNEGSNIYLSMKGPIDKLVYTYDNKQALKQVKQTLKKEQEEVKKLWRDKLGLEKDETIKEKKTESEELEFEPE